MRFTTLGKVALYAALFVLLQGAKCPSIPEMKTVEMTLVSQQSVDLPFEARGSFNTASGAEMIDIEELRQDLLDADVEISQVDTIVVSAIEIGVTAYNEPATDRRITGGTVTLTRTDLGTSQVICTNVDLQVYPLLGKLEPAPVDPAGIAFANALLADVLHALKYGGPSEFEVSATASGVSEPVDRETNFDWRVRVYYEVMGRREVEVPDL
jgi:hypothetical protein